MSEKPPLGMTKMPYGWPVMKDAFLGCAQWAIGSKDIWLRYKEDTGKDLADLANLIPRSPIEAMIDKATGHTDNEIVAFLDWVAVELWGEEEDEPIDPKDAPQSPASKPLEPSSTSDQTET